MSQDIEQAFLAAAEIAKKLPQNLQEAGFARALDQLLAGPARVEHRRDKAASGPKGAPRDVGERLIDKIDRTACPDIGATARVADRALKVLQLAHQNHDIDGLTAGEIAEILSRKFRLPVKVNTVTRALEREGTTVDVRGGPGAARVFHIMAPGDEYLAALRSNGGSTGTEARPMPRPAAKRAARRTEARAPAAPVRSSSQSASKSAPKLASKSPGSARGRPGPKAAIGQLIAADFFDAPRVITAVQEELRHRRGHSYTVQELAPALVRSIRDGSLTRTRNSSGQYEYAKK